MASLILIKKCKLDSIHYIYSYSVEIKFPIYYTCLQTFCVKNSLFIKEGLSTFPQFAFIVYLCNKFLNIKDNKVLLT